MEYKIDDNKTNVFTIMMINLFLFGTLGLIGIWLWKKGDTFDFISNLFDVSNIIIDLIVGLIITFIFLLFVHISSKFNLLTFPKNKYTEPLIDSAKKPFGPVFLGVTSGTSEEWLFRGFLLSFISSFSHPILAIIISSFIFMSLHIPQYNGHIFIHIYIFIYSVVLSATFLILNTFWAVMLSHVLYNTILFYWIRHNKI